MELATKRVLEPLFEPLFEDGSYGYRPGRNPHQCLDALGRTINQKRMIHVVEADIRGFFDHMDHDWLLTFLRQRVGAPRFLRLVRRMLNEGWGHGRRPADEGRRGYAARLHPPPFDCQKAN